jgi:hypothetical protein
LPEIKTSLPVTILLTMNFHGDPIERAQLIGKYLRRRLDVRSEDDFEAHYLGCEDCFEELAATEVLLAALSLPAVQSRAIGDVVTMEFAAPVTLTAGSPENRRTVQVRLRAIGQEGFDRHGSRQPGR